MKAKVAEYVSVSVIHDVESILRKSVIMLTFLLEKEVNVVVEQNKEYGYDIYLKTGD